MSEFPREIRYIFVQLLFSLTAAEIARETADLVTLGLAFKDSLPAWAHLSLAAAVVITSWVGWSVSEAGRLLKVEKVFSWEFVILLVDVLLVIFYFILVRGAEIPKPGEKLVASAANETKMVGLIFIGYFAWDVLTKAVVRGPEADPCLIERLISGRMKKRGWISLVCMLLAGLAWFVLSGVMGQTSVLLADAALLALVLLFRAWKENLHVIGFLLLMSFFAVGGAAWFFS